MVEQTQESVAFMQQNQMISALIDYLNPENTLRQFEHYLKGEVYDPVQSTPTKIVWRKETRFQKMNDYGVNAVMAKLYAIANPDTTLSNYTEQMVSVQMDVLTKEICLDFSLKCQDYGLDPNERFSIGMMILRIANATMRRAINESDKEFISKLFKSVESVSNIVRNGETNKGIDPFGFLKFGGKGNK